MNKRDYSIAEQTWWYDDILASCFVEPDERLEHLPLFQDISFPRFYGELDRSAEADVHG